MGEEPKFPPLKAVGNVLNRKKVLERFKCSTVKRKFYGVKNQRKSKDGHYVLKNGPEEQFDSYEKNELIISEIFSEWKQPEKRK